MDPKRDGGCCREDWTHVVLTAHGHMKAEHRVADKYFPLVNKTADPTRGEQSGPGGRGLSSARENGADGGVPEPGDMYTVYDAKDVLGNLSEDLRVITERAARWVGVECDFLCGVVERYERRLMRWWSDIRGEIKGAEM